jgi:O-6-methylguanine DNA methyltransferase
MLRSIHTPVALNTDQLDLSTIGRIWLAWNEKGLAHIAWSEPELKASISLINPLTTLIPSALPTAYRTWLVTYAKREAVDLKRIPVVLTGTAFQQRVWRCLRDIPRGALRTYGQVAAAIGSPNAVRAVGTACGANRLPIVVPCHRVIGSGLRLGGYSGGLALKIALLELEGIRVDRTRGWIRVEMSGITAK